MELLQLQYFRQVARMGSVTQAAKALRVAQPSLSKTIARLEAQVGVPLFDRKGKRLQLNEFGARFLVRVERCLFELEDGLKEVRDLANQKEQEISIGSATARMLPDLIQSYLLKRPDVKLRLSQVTRHTELLRQLEQGEIDVSITSLPLRKKGIRCQQLMTEEICLVVPPTHPLAKQKTVSLAELEHQPLIQYTSECGLREIINEFYQAAHFDPITTCECATPEVTCGLVRAGLGLAFLPAYFSVTEYAKGLVWLSLREPNLERSIWLSWNETRYLSRAACDFREFVFATFPDTTPSD